MIMNDASIGTIKSDGHMPVAVFKPLGAYMPDNDDMASITYSVKELLSDIRGSLGRLEGKLDAKADRTEVTELIRRVEAESNRITVIEAHISTQKEAEVKTTEWKRFIWPTVLSVVVIVITLLAWLDPVHVGK